MLPLHLNDRVERAENDFAVPLIATFPMMSSTAVIAEECYRLGYDLRIAMPLRGEAEKIFNGIQTPLSFFSQRCTGSQVFFSFSLLCVLVCLSLSLSLSLTSLFPSACVFLCDPVYVMCLSVFSLDHDLDGDKQLNAKEFRGVVEECARGSTRALTLALMEQGMCFLFFLIVCSTVYSIPLPLCLSPPHLSVSASACAFHCI